MNFSNIAAKTIGAAGLALVAYDSHVYGKIMSHEYPQERKANALVKNHLDYLSMDSPSIVREKFKKDVLDIKTDENFTPFCNGIVGYCKGFGHMLVDNVVPFGLAMGTLLTKGFLSKTFAVGLLGYGAFYALEEFTGIGKHEGTGNSFD